MRTQFVKKAVTYWKGSESHNIYNEIKPLVQKIRILDVSPLSCIVMSNNFDNNDNVIKVEETRSEKK